MELLAGIRLANEFENSSALDEMEAFANLQVSLTEDFQAFAEISADLDKVAASAGLKFTW